MSIKNKILVILDFDHTCARYEPRNEIDPILIEYLQTKIDNKMIWAINTDNYPNELIKIAEYLKPFERPSAILSMQRFIHIKKHGKYVELKRWNRLQDRKHKLLWKKLESLFSDWNEKIIQKYCIKDSLINNECFSYMVNQDETGQLREFIAKLVKQYKEVKVTGDGEWTYIMHSDFTKAALVLKCADIFGVDNNRIIVIGDGLNDISMFEKSVTLNIGCPSNACREVLEIIKKNGGVVSTNENAEGAIQIIEYYLNHIK